MEQHLHKATSRGIPKFSKIFSRKFSFHSTLLPENLEFSVECFAFQKFNSFRNFWKLSGKFLYLFEIFGWMESGLYQLIKYICICAIKCQPRSHFKPPLKQSCTPRRLRLTQISSERKSADKSLISFLILFYFILVNDTGVLKTAQYSSCTLCAFPSPTPFSLAF